MIAQLTSRDFSPQLCPQLCTVLSSLSVTLESELNRYRRNCHRHHPLEANLFADIDSASFDLEAIESAVEASIATASAIAKPTPPGLPPNKRLSLAPTASEPRASQNVGLALLSAESASSSLAVTRTQPNQIESNSLADRADKNTHQLANTEKKDIDPVPSSYLASSEKLIESLAQVPSMPEPINALAKPKHKTVSLLAGAALGCLGLIAGLGASYLMANPLVAQRIVDQFRPGEAGSAVAQAAAFDPPGPDLSANEFIDLELSNLSSLTMPQAVLAPDANIPANLTQAEGSSNAPTNLSPPNPSPIQPPVQSSSAASPIPPTAAPPAALAPSVSTQAVVIPTGLTYYVTVPFSSEQGLLNVRKTVSEAFVRRFSDGNRIQIAAFDNPQAAQSFITELGAKGITAQIYGPTTE